MHQAFPELKKASSGFEFLSDEEYLGLRIFPEASNGLPQSRGDEIQKKSSCLEEDKKAHQHMKECLLRN